MAFRAYPAADLEAVEFGQPEVEHDEIDASPERPLECLWTVRTHFYGIALSSQRAGEGLGDGRVILGEQYAGHAPMVGLMANIARRLLQP